MPLFKPVMTPPPVVEGISKHPSYASLPAVKTSVNKVTSIWGLLGLVATLAIPPVVKVYSDHQDTTAQGVAQKQAALKQQVDDMKQADLEAHRRIEEHVSKIEDKQEHNHTELMQALKRR
jgi:hypothetical protein